MHCTEKTPINDVAKMMSEKQIGSMLILKDGLPIGIITDKDLRNKIVSGNLPITAPASNVNVVSRHHLPDKYDGYAGTDGHDET